MFNSERPTLENLPSSAQLLKSTIIAALSAIVILVSLVLPAEYGIDPTGVGRVIGLTEMGEVKSQLAEEAEMDRQMLKTKDDQSNFMDNILGLFVGIAQAQTSESWRDEIKFTLAPGESAEWKLLMTAGQKAEYRMTVEGGRVNFDLHGHGSGQSITYERGRGSSGSEGSFLANFAGEHGWFWRNRDKSVVTIVVQVRGEYSELRSAK